MLTVKMDLSFQQDDIMQRHLQENRTDLYRPLEGRRLFYMKVVSSYVFLRIYFV